MKAKILAALVAAVGFAAIHGHEIVSATHGWCRNC